MNLLVLICSVIVVVVAKPQGYNLTPPLGPSLIPRRCSNGQVLHVDGRCVTPRVNRRVFLYDVPRIPTPSGPPPFIPAPTVETNLLFFVNYAEGENPTLPNGVDLQTALSAASDGGGQIIGGLGDLSAVSNGFGSSSGFVASNGFGSSGSLGTGIGFGSSNGFRSNGGIGDSSGFGIGNGFVGSNGFGSNIGSGGSNGFGNSGSLGTSIGLGSRNGFGNGFSVGGSNGFGSNGGIGGSTGFGTINSFGSSSGFGGSNGFGSGGGDILSGVGVDSASGNGHVSSLPSLYTTP
ncbi:glycine-rich protein 5-like [Penaeus japonicus]|uniref:glycine-rich protein 5-like n=1 Tax=Penaeus japonicus TaxID=27405 RepID=UPI001C70CC78|nr:glycine-rich protein 5-like [Penaeus japonicus]